MNGTRRLTNKVGWVLCALLGGVLAWMLAGCTAHAAEVSVEVSVVAIHTENDFYEPLGPYGRWEVVGSYGRCWIPNRVEADWCPYSNGYWRRTDDGWYWESDEPWGWATYHYGRWDSSPQFGWYWVPQTQWAPAWVSWREGGGYIGWAPLGPSGRGVVEVEERGVAPRGYVFVEERRFLEPVRLKTVVVNRTVINKTVINKGPDTVSIEKATGRKIQAAPARELRSTEEAKVVAKRPTPTPASEKAVTTPVRSQAEKTLPASEPRQVAKPVITTAEPQPPATKKDLRPADEQSRAAQLAAEQRAKEDQAASEKNRKNAAREDQNKKDKEQEAAPENPDVSPKSPR